MKEFVRELKESAAGLHDGMGGHVDHCADLMDEAAKHIAELEENATAQALALKAAKAMQKAETERADKMELRLEAVRALFFGAVPSNDELDIAISHARNNNQ